MAANYRFLLVIKAIKIKLLILFLLIASTAILQSQTFSKHTVNGNYTRATSVYAIDLDGDGDMDILGTSYQLDDITWWENDGNENFTQWTIDGSVNGAYDMYPADIDGDGDLDVVAAAYIGNYIAWWENDGTPANNSWTKHLINNANHSRAISVYAADMDGDGDLDVLEAVYNDDDIVWWENDGTPQDNAWPRHILNLNYNGACSVFAIDIDNDGDMDALGTARLADDITWWENNGSQSYTQHTIDGSYNGANSVYACDLDGDGDIDILGAASEADDITWWENDGSENFTKHTIDGNFDKAYSVYAIDMDDDGDIDVLGAAKKTNDIAWWENDGNESFTKHFIDDSYQGAFSVYAEDVNNDGHIDVLGAAYGANDITWWEQLVPLAGDYCSTAIPINEVTDLAFNTTIATASGVNPSCGGNTNPVDLWYAFTAQATGTASFDLCGSNFDTRLAIWDACGGSELNCNEDDNYCGPGSDQSYFSMLVYSGTTYYVQVGGRNAETGSGDLTISIEASPSNDNCANAIPVGDITDLPFTTITASASGTNPGCGGNTDPIDIWYAYTAPLTGTASFDLCGSTFNTRLAVYSSCGGSVLACNDDDDYCGTGSEQSMILLSVISGTTYYVQVSGNDNATGNGDLTIKTVPAATNDDCANAIAIGNVTDLDFTTIGATAGGDNPSCGGSNPVDIWYAYTAPLTGIAIFDLCGSNYNTRLAIWNNCSGSVLACNDDNDYCSTGSRQSYISMAVVSGTVYYVQVGGYNAETGIGNLSIATYAYPANDNCANAIAINEVTDLAYSTFAATASGVNPGCGGSTNPIDIWYTYTATVTGSALFDLCGSTYNTRLAIYSSCGGSVLACNDDDNYCGLNSEQSTITLSIISGSTYYIQVSGNNNSIGNGDLTINAVAIAPGDDCANAVPINEVTDLEFTTIGATVGGDNPGCGGTDPVDIWYAYTATSTGMAAIDLCGSAFDTRLAVWDACSGNIIDCNDDNDYCGDNSYQSYLSTAVTSGNTYYIQIGGYGTYEGIGNITIVIIPYPTNDDCSNAIAINEVDDLLFTTSGATSAGDNPGCGGNTDPIDIWYAYTPSMSGTAEFDLCGSAFDTRLAVWDACSGNILDCNDDDDYCNSGSLMSYISMEVDPSTTYYVQVGGNGSESGNGDITINLSPSLIGQWVGIVDTDWDNANNWAIGIVPYSTVDAKILDQRSYYPEVDETASCKNLLVEETFSLTVNTAGDLTVTGNFLENGIFVMNDGVCSVTGNLHSSSTSTIDINSGTLSMNAWYENGSSTWASGKVELSGGTINVTTDVLMNNANSNSLMDGPFNLNINGSLEMESSSFSSITDGTISMKGAGTVLPVTTTGTFKVHNLTIDATGTYIFSRNSNNNYDSVSNNFSVLSGTVQFLSADGTGKPENFFVGNNISVSSGATLTADINNEMTLRGNLINNGTFNHNSGLFVFDGSTTISGSSETSFENVIIHSSKEVTGPGSGIINIGGNFTNNGTFNHNSGTLQFNGTTQTIDGASSILYNNLTINSGSTTTINSNGNTLYGVLKSDGTLNTGGNLTLLSTSSQTALIDGSGVGSISDNITMQRYLSSRFGYRYISSPFTSATANEFSTYVDLSADFPPLYRYDENKTSAGWVNYSVSTNTLVPLHGYAINFGSASTALTFDMSGIVNNGTLTSLTLYNHNQTYTEGFNLVGNPYPSPIDWDAASGWTRTNIDDAVYYFNPSTTDQYGGAYSSYVNGVSSDGIANGIIPSMQAYFIHVSDGSYPVTATFATNNSVRVNNLSPTYHKNIQVPDGALLRLCADYSDDAEIYDPLVIYFRDSASTVFQKTHDALKLINSDEGVPNLFAISSDQMRLSIYSVPQLVDSMRTVPLGLITKKDMMLTINACNIEMFSNDVQIYLHDKKLGKYHNLIQDPEYNVFLPSGESIERFSIIFSQKDLRYKPSDNEIFYAYNNGNKIYIYINTPLESSADVAVTNIVGQIIWRGELYGKGYHDFSIHADPGIYILSIRSNNGNYSKKLFINNG